MKSLIWKEFHKNLKWGVLALLVVGGLMRLTLRNPDLESIMSPRFLAITTVIGAAFAMLLGFVGDVWVVRDEHGEITVTDLAGQVPPELKGREVDNHLVRMDHCWPTAREHIGIASRTGCS
jgi:hypothetical protein